MKEGEIIHMTDKDAMKRLHPELSNAIDKGWVGVDLICQSSIDVEALVRDDLLKIIEIAREISKPKPVKFGIFYRIRFRIQDLRIWLSRKIYDWSDYDDYGE